ncbi:transposase [Larkinella bovis]|uniref:Transposase n=1 Tax=Larkinella bovis TaxID=683041 RepID=A0ABW0I8N7_9BACT
MSLPSPKMLAQLMVKSASWLGKSDQQTIKRICQDSIIAQVYSLVETFTRMIRQQGVNLLDDWLRSCRHCPSKLLQQFGRKIEYDYQAVRAAITSEWSNAQTEGQVTRLKLLKRQMYGRAKLDLLRQRILYRYDNTQIA